MTDELRRVLDRDLAAMGREIEAYPEESDLWADLPGVSNPGGSLALHVAGNLRHFVGAVLGGGDYVRDRAAEFGARGVPRSRILEELEAARTAVNGTLPGLEPGTLDATYPLDLGGTRLSTRQFLVHLATHLAYHLGQVDIHRRAVSGGGAVEGPVSIPALSDGS